jgi:hypothetical protein
VKADKFAVVVQWGAGHIYFISFHGTEGKAQLAANAHAVVLSKRRKKRGAKPEVMVWHKLSTGVQFVRAAP